MFIFGQKKESDMRSRQIKKKLKEADKHKNFSHQINMIVSSYEKALDRAVKAEEVGCKNVDIIITEIENNIDHMVDFIQSYKTNGVVTYSPLMELYYANETLIQQMSDAIYQQKQERYSYIKEAYQELEK